MMKYLMILTSVLTVVTGSPLRQVLELEISVKCLVGCDYLHNLCPPGQTLNMDKNCVYEDDGEFDYSHNDEVEEQKDRR